MCKKARIKQQNFILIHSYSFQLNFLITENLSFQTRFKKQNFKQKNVDSIFFLLYLFAPVIIEHPIYIYIHIQAEVFGLRNPPRKFPLPLNNPHIEHA